MMPFRFFFGALILALAVPFCAAADSAQRPLTDQDAETWRMIYTPILSRDGQWLAYSYMPQERDGDIVLLNISKSGKLHCCASRKEEGRHHDKSEEGLLMGMYEAEAYHGISLLTFSLRL